MTPEEQREAEERLRELLDDPDFDYRNVLEPGQKHLLKRLTEAGEMTSAELTIEKVEKEGYIASVVDNALPRRVITYRTNSEPVLFESKNNTATITIDCSYN